MKPGAILIAGFLFVSSIAQAQQRTDSLTAFSKIQAAHFAKQQERIKTYREAYRRPLSFLDEKGNYARLADITPEGFPIYLTTLNAGAAITTGAAQLENGNLGMNLQGDGIIVGVWDAGGVWNHVEFDQRVIATEGPIIADHATHVTGTLIAKGINPQAKGMAPKAQASTHDFGNDLSEMAALATSDQNSILISNHSYGTVVGWHKSGGWFWAGDSSVNAIEDYRFGFYGSRANAIDQVAALAPYYTIVWAAGNDRADVGNGQLPPDCNGGSGYDCIIPESVAKNIITVGAVEKVFSYTNPFDVPMSFFSSWGPTDDGRIKPDLVGAGVNLFSTITNNNYATLSGTSMATPNVAGSLILLQDLYHKMHAGRFMKSATLKALAIHTVKEAGNFPGPDYSFGWGLLDVEAAAKVLVQEDGTNTRIGEFTLLNDSTWTMPLTPQANQKITATIVWTDPPFTPLAPSLDPTTANLVNDLDLRIIDDQGREQLPWALDPLNPTHQAFASDNFRDNVEKIEFVAPQEVKYRLVVRHKGVLMHERQDFSIIVTYQSVNSFKTFYWVGDSGSWTDASHWSLSTGGSPAMLVPGFGDKVIIDENSFDGIGTDEISLNQDAACRSLLWINSKASGLSLNAHTLSVGSQFRIANPLFSISTLGTLRFQSVASGNLFMRSHDLSNAALSFEGGRWELNGSFSASALQVSAGEVDLKSDTIFLNRLESLTASPKQIHFNGSLVRLSGNSTFDGTSLLLTSGKASIQSESGNVGLHWQSVNFPGALRVSPGTAVSFDGGNELGRINNEGILTVNGSNQIDTLNLEPGSVLNLAPSTTLTLSSQTQMDADSINLVSIASSGDATLSFSERTKFCFDYLNVSGVNVTGSSQVVAGIHSTLANASGWTQGLCDDILFADFFVSDNCSGGITQFSNRSTGNIKSYDWTFDSGITTIHDVSPVKTFAHTGNYPVTLTVSDGISNSTVTQIIAVKENSLLPNQVTFNGSFFTSVQTATRYQWFRDGVALPGATARSYIPEVANGVYFVIDYDAQCNRVSDTLAVTGVPEASGPVAIFPNPASEWIQIDLPDRNEAGFVLLDLLGREYLSQQISERQSRIPIQGVPAGIYIVQVNSGGKFTRKKIVIQR